MLDTKILELTYELKDKILESEEYKLVKEKERLMEENCVQLLIKYNSLMDEYNNSIRFEKYGSDIEFSRKKLAECKLELDTNEYVKEYKQAYKNMNKMLSDIEKSVFKGLMENKKIEIE